jgi:hypothetical protein
MPRTVEDVENYLLQLGRRYEASGSTFVLQSSPGEPPIAVRVASPIVAVNADIGDVPEAADLRLKVFQRLLELNATDLMHAAYGIENGKIVLSAALVLENLDQSELSATLSDIDMALLSHTKQLHELAHVAAS